MVVAVDEPKKNPKKSGDLDHGRGGVPAPNWRVVHQRDSIPRIEQSV